MSMHQVAEHLAAMGRGNDTMLMHVTPKEVAGLDSLARSMGGEITINPQTGLPEAGFFDFVADYVVPIGLGFINPGLAAAYSGIKSYAETGDLGAGVLSAATSYGTGKLGQSLGSMGAPDVASKFQGAQQIGEAAASGAANSGVMAANAAEATKQALAAQSSLSNVANPLAEGSIANAIAQPGVMGSGSVLPQGFAGVQGLPGGQAGAAIGKVPLVQPLEQGASSAMDIYKSLSPLQKAEATFSGIGKAIQSPSDFVKAAGSTGDALFQVGSAASPLLSSALEPAELEKSKEDKYDPYATLNLSGDTGLRLFAAGGIANLEPQDDRIPTMGHSPYGLTSLNSQQSQPNVQVVNNTPAINQPYGGINQLPQPYAPAYAKGGDVGLFADKPGLNVGTPGTSAAISGGTYSPAQFEQMYNTYNQNRNLMSSFMVNPNKRPEVSPEQTQFNKMMQQSGPRVGGDPFGNLLYGRKLSDEQKAFNQQLQDYNKARTDYYKQQSPLKGFGGIYGGGAGTGGVGFSKPLNIWQGNTAMPGSGVLNTDSGARFAKGGYLDGPGDGMSDSIPATIEGKQPARLADGEFVIPADVVSHLGNGSTKAGAKKLYEMLDRVRVARTGNKKQGKQINPNKLMPV